PSRVRARAAAASGGPPDLLAGPIIHSAWLGGKIASPEGIAPSRAEGGGGSPREAPHRCIVGGGEPRSSGGATSRSAPAWSGAKPPAAGGRVIDAQSTVTS